ncbi:MAG: hypothetical protein ACLR17_21800 [Enterobacteriaceae bacterium]
MSSLPEKELSREKRVAVDRHRQRHDTAASAGYESQRTGDHAAFLNNPLPPSQYDKISGVPSAIASVTKNHSVDVKLRRLSNSWETFSRLLR